MSLSSIRSIDMLHDLINLIRYYLITRSEVADDLIISG